MAKHIVYRIIAGLVLLAVIAGIAFFAFRAGVDYGAAANFQQPAVENGLRFYPHFGFFGFGIFGWLFVFFLIALAFGAMRRLVWGPRWGWRHMHGPMEHGPMGHGPMGHGPWGEGVPPMFAEWHRRAHEQPEEKKTGE